MNPMTNSIGISLADIHSTGIRTVGVHAVRYASAVSILLVTAGVASSAAAVPMTFPEALARLRAENGRVLAADDEVQQRREELGAARGLYYPRVEATGSATWIDDPIVLDLDPIRSVILQLHPGVPEAAIPPFQETIQDDHYQRSAVGVTWPIFTGGRILAANQAAAARLDDSREMRRDTEEGLTTELVRRFYGLQMAKRIVAVRADARDGLSRHLYQAQRLSEEGQIATAERLRAEVAFAEADRDYKNARRDLAIVRASLSGLLAVEDTVDASSPLFLLLTIEPVDRFRDTALSGNPALGRLDAQRRLASASTRAEASAWLPDVYLFGRRELNTSDLTVLEPEWAAGVGARWTLFDGFARLHRYRAARDAGDRVDDLRAQARRDIGTLVTQRHEQVLRALDAYRSLDASLAAATENLRVREEAFSEGMATSLDVTDAQLMLSRVRIERLAAAYAFDVALAELLEACGQTARLEEYILRADVEVDS